MYPYFREENESRRPYYISGELTQAVLDNNSREFFIGVHDITLRVLRNLRYYEPRHNEEPDEIASFVADVLWWDTKETIRRRGYKYLVKNWYKKVFKSIYRWIAWYRKDFSFIEDRSRILADETSREQLFHVSGYFPVYGYDLIIDQQKVVTIIELEDLFDYVMTRYCIFNEDSKLRKGFERSLTLSLVRGTIVLDHLPRKYTEEVRFLANTFRKFYNEYIEKGRIEIED